MTVEEQRIEEIPLDTLLERVQGMLTEGCRLVQICCTRLDADHEVNYSFDRGPGSPARGLGALPGSRVKSAASVTPCSFHTLRVRLPLENPRLPSISRFYWSAFLYENEIHDLFGVEVRGMAVDFQGKFYRTAVPTPYARKETGNAE